MPKPRRDMTARVVPLHSRDAGNATVGGSVAERLMLVAQLSETSWQLTGYPLPVYTRETMPVVVTTLKAQGGRESP
ncbi:MAG: hypothetical protein ACRENQ_12745 [Gemmatimonadaceae bacterium]